MNAEKWAELSNDLLAWREEGAKFKETGNIDGSIVYYDKVYELSKTIIEKLGRENTPTHIVTLHLDATYNIAFCFYQKDDFQTALSLLQSMDMGDYPLSFILAALCIIQTGDASDFKAAFQLLTLLETKATPSFTSSLSGQDQLLVSTGFLYLALFYRKTMADIDKAFSVLNKGHQLLSGASQQMLAEEMAHYQKEFFGGYRYVE